MVVLYAGRAALSHLDDEESAEEERMDEAMALSLTD
jgi:hypothetical protein